MQSMRVNQPWLRFVGIAAAYALIYAPMHIIWISHWQLTAGLRLACLLLVPPRYWPALVLGEAVAVGKVAYECAPEQGIPWALALMFAPIGLNMLAVWLFRKFRPVIDSNNQVVVSSMLSCIFASTILCTAALILQYALMQWLLPENRWSLANVSYFSYLWFLGAGLGIFMIVPQVMWAYTEGALGLHDIGIRIARNRALREAVVILLPILYTLALIVQHVHSEPMKHVAQIAMLFAPACLAQRHGWQGASLACMFANLTVVLTMPVLHDPTTVQTQALMLVSSTLWLLLGARISVVRLRVARAI